MIKFAVPFNKTLFFWAKPDGAGNIVELKVPQITVRRCSGSNSRFLSAAVVLIKKDTLVMCVDGRCFIIQVRNQATLLSYFDADRFSYKIVHNAQQLNFRFQQFLLFKDLFEEI